MQNNCGSRVMGKDVDYAGFWVRLAAYLLDSVLVFFMLLLVRLIMAGVMSVLQGTPLGGNILFHYTLKDIVLYLAQVFYFIICTYSTGTTVGKKAMNLRVVSADGNQKMDLMTVVYRETVGRFLSGLLAGIGYLLVGIDKEKRGIHDMLCDTRVIYAKKLKNYPVYQNMASVPPVQTPPVQVPPMQTSPVQTPSAVQSSPVQTSSVQTPPVQASAVQSSPAQASSVQTPPMQASAVQSSPAQASSMQNSSMPPMYGRGPVQENFSGMPTADNRPGMSPEFRNGPYRMVHPEEQMGQRSYPGNLRPAEPYPTAGVSGRSFAGEFRPEQETAGAEPARQEGKPAGPEFPGIAEPENTREEEKTETEIAEE